MWGQLCNVQCAACEPAARKCLSGARLALCAAAAAAWAAACCCCLPVGWNPRLFVLWLRCLLEPHVQEALWRLDQVLDRAMTGVRLGDGTTWVKHRGYTWVLGSYMSAKLYPHGEQYARGTRSTLQRCNSAGSDCCHYCCHYC
jgi:hypothetical protein